ncbi:MAG TPA: hypothetical protein VF487_13530 [Chitinophagaceae bacterium]
MIKEKVLVLTISITKPKEIKNFQIILPADTKRIIGVEFGTIRTFYAETGNYNDPEWIQFPNTNDSLFHVRPNKTVGEFSLLTLGKENIFLKSEVKDKESNTFWADFSKPVMNQFAEWTHCTRKEEFDVDVNGNEIVEGCFKDRWGIINELIVRYTFHLYLWIEKICKNDI